MPKQAPTLLEHAKAEAEVVTSAPEPEKKPEPKPGDADYDWTQHYDDGTELYTHTFSDGKVIVIKSMGAVYSKTWLYKIHKMTSASQMEIASLDRACCDVASDLLMNLDDTDTDPVEELISGWIKDATGRGDGDEGLTSGN